MLQQRKLWRGRSVIWRTVVTLLCAVALTTVLVTVALVTKVEPGEGKTTSAPELSKPVPVLIEGGAGTPLPERVNERLRHLANAPELGELYGQVINAGTREILWESRADEAVVPASATKLLTAAAALRVLGEKHTVETAVFRGQREGEIVVKSQGDPTMTVLERSARFPGAPTLDELVERIRQSGATVDSVVVDTSAYAGKTLAPGWSIGDIRGGYVAPIESWMLDAGRINPSVGDTPRSRVPAMSAARALAQRLGLKDGSATVAFNTPVVGRELARISSAPLGDRVRVMLTESDNVLAETICRETAAQVHPELPRSFETSTLSTLEVLNEAGVDTSGAYLADCSGMSMENRIPPQVLTRVLADAADSGSPASLGTLFDGVAIGGATGTLANRYIGVDPGAGWVRAKTGTLTGVSALVGTVSTMDGDPLLFAFVSIGANPVDARPYLDALATALHECGCE